MTTNPAIRTAPNARTAIRNHQTSWVGKQYMMAALDRYERTEAPCEHEVDRSIDILLALVEIAALPGRSPALPTETWILTGLEGLIRRAAHDPTWQPIGQMSK